MTLGRIELSGPIAAIVVGSVSVVALRTASDFWYRAAYSMTAVSLMFATIAAIWKSNLDRAFWFGFASFGWFTFISLLGLHGDGVEKLGAGLANEPDPKLIGTNILLELVPILRKATIDPLEIDRITRYTFGVAALLAVFAVATCGGFIAVVLRRTNRRFVPKRTLVYRSDRVVFASIAVAIAVTSLCLGLLPKIVRIPTTPRPAIRYFPSSSVQERAGFTNEQADRYTKILEAMREKSLFGFAQRSVDSATIRMILLNQYEHPLCVRIEKHASGAELRVVVVDGSVEAPARIAIDANVRLDQSDWKKLSKLLDEVDFWNLETITVDPEKKSYYAYTILLEGLSGGRYHVVSLVDPDPKFTRLLRFLLESSGLEIRDKLIYYYRER